MRLQERADYLDAKIKAEPEKNMAYDAQERSALWWAISQIEFLDSIEEAVKAVSLTDDERLFAIAEIIEARRRPSALDLERHPGLRKTVEAHMERRAIAREIRDAARAVTSAASAAPKE